MARGAGWSNEATRALISLWGEANVQEKLDGVSRNRTIYEGIAEGMREAGYDYSWKQCRTKVKNLTQKYCKVSFQCLELLKQYVLQVKDNNRQTGNGRKTCPFYKEVDAILGTRASSEPIVVLENCGVASVEQELLEGNSV